VAPYKSSLVLLTALFLSAPSVWSAERDPIATQEASQVAPQREEKSPDEDRQRREDEEHSNARFEEHDTTASRWRAMRSARVQD
jgi:hypothetical protein